MKEGRGRGRRREEEEGEGSWEREGKEERRGRRKRKEGERGRRGKRERECEPATWPGLVPLVPGSLSEREMRLPHRWGKSLVIGQTHLVAGGRWCRGPQRHGEKFRVDQNQT